MTATTSRLAPEPSTRGRGRNIGADPAATTLALLPIGADLLPRGGGSGRSGRRTHAVAVGLVLAAGLGVGGAWAYAGHEQSSAVAALTAAQDRQRDLQTRQRTFQEVASVQTQAAALRTALTALMATDTPWSTVLADLSRIRGGVTFTSVQGSVTDPAAAAATGTAVTTPGAVGSLVINGAAADKPTIAAFVEALGEVPGFADPFLSAVSESSGSPAGSAGSSTFTVTVSLTGDLRAAATSRWSTGAVGTSSTGGGK